MKTLNKNGSLLATHRNTLTGWIRTSSGPLQVQFRRLTEMCKAKTKIWNAVQVPPMWYFTSALCSIHSVELFDPGQSGGWFFSRIPQVLTALWSLTAGSTGFGSCGETSPCAPNRSWRRRCCWSGDLFSVGSLDTYSATFSSTHLEPAKLDNFFFFFNLSGSVLS